MSTTEMANATTIATMSVSWSADMTTTEIAGNQTAPAGFSHGERVFIGLAWLTISILGMFGNGMVILAVALSRRLRTPTNVFVVNLAVADFLVCVCLPWSVAGLLSKDGISTGAQGPCAVIAFVSYTSSGASLYHMASIALNRVLLIKRPMTLYQWLFTKVKITFLVMFSWLVAILVILLPPLVGIGGLGYDARQHTCTDRNDVPGAKLYQLAQVIFFYPGPMLIIIVCYIVVFAHIRNHFKRQLKRRPSFQPSKDEPSGPVSSTFIPSDSPNVQGGDTLDSAVHERISRQQIQITKNLLMIVIVYFALITPYSVVLFMGHGRLAIYGGTLFICNTWINPVIYAAKHPQLKVVLRLMLKGRCSRIPEPSRLVRRLSNKNLFKVKS